MCIWKSGRVDIGYWKNDNRHGHMISFYMHGITEIGTSKNGRPDGELEVIKLVTKWA